MGIALIATIFFVPSLPKPATKTSLAAPLKALRHRGLLIMALVAVLYNWGFFTMLGYAPYPMKLGAQSLGLVFTGWGLLVAVFAVYVAPRLQQRFGTARVLYANMLGLAILMAVIAAGYTQPTVVIVAVIISGAFIGINNTLTTQAVMLVSPVDRPTASSAYGFVRFIGGGLAPFVAGQIADHSNLGVPFYVGAGAFLLAIGVVASGRRMLDAAEGRMDEVVPVTPTLEPVGSVGAAAGRPLIVAVGATQDAAAIVDRAADLASREGRPLQVVHVRETEIVEELAIDAEEPIPARVAVLGHLDRLADRGVAATGLVLHSVGDHASAGQVLARYADEVDATAIAIGRSPRGPMAKFTDGSITTALTHATTRTVMVLGPDGHNQHA
jgi:nucleotide-binding universal stress UspA family protein